MTDKEQVEFFGPALAPDWRRLGIRTIPSGPGPYRIDKPKTPPPSMNSKTTSKSMLFSAIALAGLASTFGIAAANAQVVIEGGPGVVQRTGEDGEPVAVAPVPFEADSSNAAAIETEPPAAVEVQPDPRSSVVVRVPVVDPPGPEPSVEGTAAPEVPTLDVASAKRRGELVRELGIADSGTGAKIAFDTDSLYERDLAVIDSSLEGSLELLAEFARLLPVGRVVITYHYSPTLHSETLAWQRSVSLAEWLRLEGGIAGPSFTLNEPTVKDGGARAQAAATTGPIPPLEKVEIMIEYR